MPLIYKMLNDYKLTNIKVLFIYCKGERRIGVDMRKSFVSTCDIAQQT